MEQWVILYDLLLEKNHFEGLVPSFNQHGMEVFNVFNNQFYGRIPTTRVMAVFNASSFAGNHGLYGSPFPRPCVINSSDPLSMPYYYNLSNLAIF